MFGGKDIPSLSSSMMKSYELLDEELHNALNELRSLNQKYDPSNANKKVNCRICSILTKSIFRFYIICSMFNKADCEISQLVVWDDPMAIELEKLLIPHIKVLDFGTFSCPLFEVLKSCAGYILLEMVFVLKDMKPFLSVGEAMWLLLICDLNILQAVANATPILISQEISKSNQKLLKEGGVTPEEMITAAIKSGVQSS
ncbi:PREDICTED: putative E3 ubiquitin-protein ligase RF4 [Ipomoea nil]|uniref:putative E3 ubiquitin-protein ligase RF4 n=1 Tax=Ipomoea nil TaxID=35883 RepID=UPI0009013CE6|nr:PREDICTED: putative E3 ubiquitin-protein ligase RF4 [Ipomoea nil]